MANFKIPLKSGLEIHQQLDTHKLFCSCPSQLMQDKPDFLVSRKLRGVAGETGKVDLAAAYEAAKSLEYIYEGYNDTTCLVELDEEPPHQINQEALNTAILVAKMLNCRFPDVLQVMRKTVVDGSNTSGFQRSVLIGTDGWLETKHGRVGIENVSLEEDSARRTSETKESVNYRLDRLGIPLIEIGTAPDMKSPEQVQEVARQIGAMLRATGKAMRGIGTIRQDVNISTKNHPRVELKGVQDLRSMPEVVKREAERQQAQVRAGKRELPHVRNVKPDGTSKYLRPMPGAARMYPETDHPLIYLNIERNDVPRGHAKPTVFRLEKKIAEMKLPEMPDEKISRYKKLGLSEELAKQLVDSTEVELFEALAKKFRKVPAKLIASTLISTSKDIQRKLGQVESSFSEEHYETLFNLVSKGTLTKEAIPTVLEEVAKGAELEKAAKKFKPLSRSELKKEIDRIKKANKNAPENKLKGIIIGQLRSRANVEDILNLI